MRLVNGKLIVSRRILSDFGLQLTNISLKTFNIGCQTLELTLRRLRLLQQHLNALESLTLIIEFPSQNIIADFTILPRFISQIVQHLFWSEILAGNFLCIHQSLSHSEALMLVEFNRLGQLAFFLVEAGVLLLLFAQFRGSFEQCLEIFPVALVFEVIDLRQQLLFLLFKLRDFLLKFIGVHTFSAETLNILMDGAEFRLQVPVNLHCAAHILVDHEFVGDLKGHQEASRVRLAL